MPEKEDYEHEDEAHDWKDKPPVLTIVKRGRSTPRVRYKVMKKTFQHFIGKLQSLINGDVIMNTDEYTIYEGIAEKIPEVQEHHIVNQWKS
ncbi:MAG: hypothetical protein QHH19_00175 [Candidatus Thermoplasmatota archaeon]|nr:hypothetical protein [Candidatus Thermoplasmatota archaeon]